MSELALFDTTPKPAFLRGLKHQKWTMAGALSELVDNSFGKLRGDAGCVWIDHDVTRRIIEVLDNGRGMDAVGRLFQLGNTIGRGPGDIGIYGYGGTQALIWAPSIAEVTTLRDGRVSHHRMNWQAQLDADHFFSIPNEWAPATILNTPPKLLQLGHGTLIRLHLSRERSFVVSNVVRDLSQTYSPGIRNGKKLLWRTLKKGEWTETRPIVDAFEMPQDKANRVDFNLTLEAELEDGTLTHLPVRGVIGLVPDLPYAQSVVSVGYGHRVITKTRECYASQDGSEKFIGAGIAGWLDLGDGWQPFLSTTKDALNDTPLWDALMEHVFQQIRPLLQKTENHELNVFFDDVCLMLKECANAISALRIDVMRGEATEDDQVPQLGDNPHGEGKDVEPGEPRTPDLGSSDGADAKKAPAISAMVIVRASEKAMGGALCRVSINGNDELIGSINIDHEWVREILKSKPINHRAFIYMIVREMASAICEDEVIRRRIFKPSLLRVIEDKSGTDRERYIARLLLDKSVAA